MIADELRWALEFQARCGLVIAPLLLIPTIQRFYSAIPEE